MKLRDGLPDLFFCVAGLAVAGLVMLPLTQRVAPAFGINPPVSGTGISPPATSVTLPSNEGAVSGAIIRCYGIGPALGVDSRVAGTVTAYTKGTPVISEHVAELSDFFLTLPPGSYVLVGHWDATNLPDPQESVTVVAGETTVHDLIYSGCM